MHHELPERLDIAWYRSRAKELVRDYRAGAQEARERVHEGIGQRPDVKLADAQRVIALEHGFARWAEFRHWIETRSPEPSVGRIGRAPVSTYERRAERLVYQVRSGDSDALRRVRFRVARPHDYAGTDIALRDAASSSLANMVPPPGATLSCTRKKGYYGARSSAAR